MTDYYAYVDGAITNEGMPASMYAMEGGAKDAGSVYADADYAVDAYGPRFNDLQEKMLKMKITNNAAGYYSGSQAGDTTNVEASSSFYYMANDDEGNINQKDGKAEMKHYYATKDGYAASSPYDSATFEGGGDAGDIYTYAEGKADVKAAAVASSSSATAMKRVMKASDDSMYVVVGNGGGGGGAGSHASEGDYYEIVGKYAPTRERDERVATNKAAAAKKLETKAKAELSDEDDADSDSGAGSDDGESDEGDDFMDEDHEDGSRGAPTQAGMGRVGGEFWAKYYWNEKFQTVLERPTTTPEEAKQRSSDIHGLARLFVDEAVPVVKQIVSEILLPDEDKAIKPVNVGGVAGGDKYMTKQLFIKFAKDDTTYHLYGGDDFAQKAAGHELKSLNSLISCNVRSLHFPLMALANYLGYRVIVISKLPIGSATLKYGSADGGFTIASDKGFSKKMKQIANVLNLKGHYVKERKTGTLKLMYGPVDIEGHIGLDGRYYCVDTARLFPPVTPNLAVRGCHLFRLLRSEAVKKSPHPLSSDAFTGWGAHNKKKNNCEVIAATKHMLHETIPFLVNGDILRALEKRLAIEGLNKIPEIDIKSLLHEQGVNMRYAGMLAHYASGQLPGVRNLLWAQMIGRAFAAIVHNSMRSLPAPRPREDYYGLAINYLNLLLGCGAQSEAFWNDEVMVALKRRFVFHEQDTESLGPNLRTRVLQLREDAEGTTEESSIEASVQKWNILQVVLSLTAIKLRPDTTERLAQGNDETFASAAFTVKTPLALDELESIGIRWKIMGLLDLAERKGAEGDFKEAENYYKEELRIKRAALGNVHPLLAMPLASLAHLYATANKQKKAEQAYLKALTLLKKTLGSDHVEVASILDNLASLYIRYDQVEKAEVALVEALRIKRQGLKKEGAEENDDSDVATTLEALALAYTKQGKLEEAEDVYEQVMRIKEAEYGPRHWEVARTLHHRCLLLLSKGPEFFPTALPLADSLVEMVQEARGAEHSDVGIALDTLGQVYVGLGRHSEAETVFKNSLRIKAAAVGPRHSSVAATLDHLAYALAPNEPLLPAAQLEKAVECAQKAMELFVQIYGENHSHVGLVKNNLGVLYVLGGHLTAARGLFQSSLAILHKSHAASHPLLVSVRANLEQVEAHLVDDAATGPGTIDVRQLKRYFHGQHFYYSPFGDTKREEKMQKAEEAQAQQEQGDKKKPIPPEWQKLFAQANIDVAALSYEKAQALIAALKKKLTDPSPVGGAAKQDTDRSRLTQSALVPHSTGDSDQGRADLLRSQPARMRLAPIKPIAPIAPIAPITCAPADPSAYYASADHDDDDPYGYAGGPPPTPIAPPAQPTGTAYYADSDDFYGADIDGGVPLGDAMHEGYAGAAVDANMAASVYAYAEGAPVSSDDAAAATSQSLSLVMSARRTAAATASGSDDDDEGWADEPFQPMILLEQASLITGGGGGEQQPDDPTAMAAMELEEENAIRHALALEKEPSAEELASRQRLEEVTRNLAGVREIAGQVVEDMVNRADSLANIEARTEELTLQAERFRRGSKELHQRPSLLSRLPSISSVFSRFLGTTRQASESRYHHAQHDEYDMLSGATLQDKAFPEAEFADDDAGSSASTPYSTSSYATNFADDYVAKNEMVLEDEKEKEKEVEEMGEKKEKKRKQTKKKEKKEKKKEEMKDQDEEEQDEEEEAKEEEEASSEGEGEGESESDEDWVPPSKRKGSIAPKVEEKRKRTKTDTKRKKTLKKKVQDKAKDRKMVEKDHATDAKRDKAAPSGGSRGGSRGGMRRAATATAPFARGSSLASSVSATSATATTPSSSSSSSQAFSSSLSSSSSAAAATAAASVKSEKAGHSPRQHTFSTASTAAPTTTSSSFSTSPVGTFGLQPARPAAAAATTPPPMGAAAPRASQVMAARALFEAPPAQSPQFNVAGSPHRGPPAPGGGGLPPRPLPQLHSFGYGAPPPRADGGAAPAAAPSPYALTSAPYPHGPADPALSLQQPQQQTQAYQVPPAPGGAPPPSRPMTPLARRKSSERSLSLPAPAPAPDPASVRSSYAAPPPPPPGAPSAAHYAPPPPPSEDHFEKAKKTEASTWKTRAPVPSKPLSKKSSEPPSPPVKEEKSSGSSWLSSLFEKKPAPPKKPSPVASASKDSMSSHKNKKEAKPSSRSSTSKGKKDRGSMELPQSSVATTSSVGPSSMMKSAAARESELAGLRLNIGGMKKKAASRLNPEQLRQQQQMEVEGVSLDIGDDDNDDDDDVDEVAAQATTTAPSESEPQEKQAYGGDMLIEDWEEKKKTTTTMKKSAPKEQMSSKGKEKMMYEVDEEGEEDDDEEDEDLLNWDLDDEDDDDDEGDKKGGDAAAADKGDSAEDADLLALIGEEKEKELIAFLQQAQTDRKSVV